MGIRTVRGGEWREYRQIRLAALKDAPAAFGSTWREEAALTEERWRERAQRASQGDDITMVIATDDTGGWIGLAGGYRPGEPGADAELISMWVSPGGRGAGTGTALVRAVVAWADSHRATTVGLWVTVTNQPAIGLYQNEGFRPTGATDQLPSDPTQLRMRMLRRGGG